MSPQRFSSKVVRKALQGLATSSNSTFPSASHLRKISAIKRDSHVDFDTTFIPDAALVSPRELIANLGRLSRAPNTVERDIVEKYIQRAFTLTKTNELSCRDYVNFLHCLSRLTQSSLKDVDVCPLLKELGEKLRNNRRFKKTLTTVDIAVCLNSLTRLKNISDDMYSRCTEIVRVLGDEIHSRISHFDDHHLAIILHCYSKFNIRDRVVIEDVISEIELTRTLSEFTLQSTIMLASSCAQLDVMSLMTKHKYLAEGLWESIQMKLIHSKIHEFQPEWADVALTSIAKSGIPPTLISTHFLQAMAENVVSQAEASKVGKERLGRTIMALTKLNGHPDLISRLQSLRE